MAKRVSDELIGVWKRQSIAIDDESAYEDSQVIWLQTATRYADLRVALPGGGVDPSSFAGHIDWRAPVLTFHHELDLRGEFPLDVGRLELKGSASEHLIETGSVELQGKEIRFREHWQRQTEFHPSFECYESRAPLGLSAIVVEVADHRLVIFDARSTGDDYCASYARRIEGHWQIQLSIGAPLRLAETADLARGLTRVD